MGEKPIGERLAALEAHLGHVLRAIEDADRRQEDRIRRIESAVIDQINDHEERIRSLERWQLRVSGWAAAVASFVSVVWQIIWR